MVYQPTLITFGRTIKVNHGRVLSFVCFQDRGDSKAKLAQLRFRYYHIQPFALSKQARNIKFMKSED